MLVNDQLPDIAAQGVAFQRFGFLQIISAGLQVFGADNGVLIGFQRLQEIAV